MAIDSKCLSCVKIAFCLKLPRPRPLGRIRLLPRPPDQRHTFLDFPAYVIFTSNRHVHAKINVSARYNRRNTIVETFPLARFISFLLTRPPEEFVNCSYSAPLLVPLS